MLKIIEVDFSISDLISTSEDTTVNEVGNSKVVGAKVGGKMAKSKNKYRSKGRNLMKSFLAKF